MKELAEENALRDGEEGEVEDPVEDGEEPEVAGVVGESSVGILDHEVPSKSSHMVTLLLSSTICLNMMETRQPIVQKVFQVKLQ